MIRLGLRSEAVLFELDGSKWGQVSVMQENEDTELAMAHARRWSTGHGAR